MITVAATEPIHHHQILVVYISRHRNMLVAKVFLRSLIKLYGSHIVIYDDSLGIKLILHRSFEKGVIERSMDYVKDRT
jgi:transposase-like protein